jgi:hypothetical protein
MLTSTDHPVARYWAVTGRMHGDDEDTGIAFEKPCVSLEDAHERFALKMRIMSGYTGKALDREIVGDDEQPTNVYINSTFSSLAPITLH